MAAAARIRRGPRQRRGSVTHGRCSPAVPTRGGPETRWPTIPAPAWSGIPRPCSRRRDSRSASGPPPRLRPGSRIPARSAPWVASERGDVNAVTLARDETRASSPSAGALSLSLTAAAAASRTKTARIHARRHYSPRPRKDRSSSSNSVASGVASETPGTAPFVDKQRRRRLGAHALGAAWLGVPQFGELERRSSRLVRFRLAPWRVRIDGHEWARGQAIADRGAVGHGHEDGEVALGGRRVPVSRPGAVNDGGPAIAGPRVHHLWAAVTRW
jgi:hypothetical protein